MLGWMDCLCATPLRPYRSGMWLGCLLAGGALVPLAHGQGILIGANFAGSTQSQTLFYPPNSDIAVGYNDLVESINGRFSVRQKVTGQILQDTSLTGFFNTALAAGLGGSVVGYATDPRIVFDASSGRWFASARDGGSNTNAPNSLLVAVSSTSDPAGPWRAVHMASDPAGAAATDYADFPSLAVDATGVFLTPDMFSNSASNSSYLHPNIAVIPKADLLSTTMTLAHSSILVLPSDSNLKTYMTQPAGGPVDQAMPQLLASREIVGSFGHEGLRLSWVTGTASAPSLNTTQYTDIDFGTYNSSVPAAAQPGTSIKIGSDSSSDNHYLGSSVVLVNGNLWGVETWSLSSGATARDQIHWFEVSPSTGTLINDGFITDPTLSLYTASLAVNASGDVVIGCTGSSSTTYPSAYAVVGSTSGTTTSFGPLTLLQAGTSAYTYAPSSGVVRWGDYSTTVLDPADPGIFWTTQEIAVGTSNWQTQITQVVPVKTNEIRWSALAGGSFATPGNYLGGSAPGTSDHAIFSLAATYTVTLAATTTIAELSIRQGTPTLDLGSNLLTLTAIGPITALNIGEFGATPAVTIKNGTLIAPNATLAGSTNATASLALNHASLLVPGLLNVGGTSATPGGTATLTIPTYSSLSTGSVGSATPGGLYIGPGSLVQATGGTLQIAQTLTIASTGAAGKLDITNTCMVFHSTAANLTTDQSTLTAYLLSGRDTVAATGAARWDGPGIISSTAQSAPGTGIGLMTGADFLQAHPGQMFHKQAVSPADLLLEYTYNGDANFDGMITNDDYLAMNLGFIFGLSGWSHGDFNYDGVVDYRDFALIDAADALHGTLPQNYIDLHTSWFGDAYTAAFDAAIPEPASLALLTTGFIILSSRRRAYPAATKSPLVTPEP